MTYDEIIDALYEDASADELFGIEQIPRIADGTIMIVYFVEPDTHAYNLIPAEARPPDGFWFVAHVRYNAGIIEDVDWRLRNKQGQSFYSVTPIWKVHGLLKEDDKWFLVRDLSSANKKLYAMQRRLK